MKNAPTTKVQKHITTGLYVYVNDVKMCATYNDPYPYEGDWDEELQDFRWEIQPGSYSLTAHLGDMPAFCRDEFSTLQALSNAMQSRADLRKWRIMKG